MSVIAVCPLSKLDETLRRTGAEQVISLLSGETGIERPLGIARNNHLVLRFNDITEMRDDLVLPNEDHIRRMTEFADQWDRNRPLLVHCWAGISRSPAAAAIIALALEPARDEKQLALDLRHLSAPATPNIMMIKLADALLQRNNRLVDAIEGIGRGEDAFEGNSFLLPIG